MSLFKRGFFIERITVTGNGRQPAELEFRDGLNVVEGSTNTGKSYIAGLIDFAFGATNPPRKIQAAEGYDRVLVALQERKTKRRYQIERPLGGEEKAVIVRELGVDGTTVERTETLAAKHDADDDQNLSSFLLKLAGFSRAKIRRNTKGETQSLSFRNISHLAVINETRIISEAPPQHQGNRYSTTAESEVFRLVITGHMSPEISPIPNKPRIAVAAAKAQVALLEQMETQARSNLEKLGVPAKVEQEEIDQADTAHASLLSEYDAARIELGVRENERAEMVRKLRTVLSRITVIEGLIARFELLDRHYEMDIARLQAIEETGSMLEQIPTKSCPVCGAAPNAHRPDEADEHFGVENVRSAAAGELEKTKRLRTDLHNAIADLRTELEEKISARSHISSEIDALQSHIDTDTAPRARSSADKLKSQSERQRTLTLARSLVEQLADLAKRRAAATKMLTKKKRAKASTDDDESTAITTSEMDGLAQETHEILAAWHFPELGHVAFSEKTDDIVIAGQDRASNGKGARALTCAAFITGIMRHCSKKELPHPGLVVLDSPLTAYKDPDAPGTESERFHKAGVKEAFYRALASELCPGQFIILDNQEPPTDVIPKIVYHHFSKSEVGRYGFFPRATTPT